METDIILCECGSDEHQIIVHHDIEDKEVYLHIHLTNRSFFGRLIYGLKYIFGYHCRYGHWDEIVLNEKDSDKFQKIANTLKNKI